MLGPRVQRDRPLGPLTTYRVGGPATLFFEVGGEADLLAAHRAVAETAVPVLVVGRGSNLLVADAGFPGLALALGPAYDGVTVHGTAARAGGATYLPVLARRTAAGGMAGLEWAVGVPGSVGGGVRMNAGGHGSDIRAALVRAAVFDVADGTTRQVGPSDLALAYRESSVSFTQVVLWAELAGEAGDPSASRARIDEIVRWRRQHQPGGANAGSVFTNPEGDAAGRLVEAAGQRGRRLG
ncbi:MAG: FAD-binding protein, partial [Acidimicrobiales bacterium]